MHPAIEQAHDHSSPTSRLPWRQAVPIIGLASLSLWIVVGWAATSLLR